MTSGSRQLLASLASMDRVAVAISGGVDSVTLATFAHRHHGHVQMLHAVSPAVPAEATSRVAALARQEGWRLSLLDAGEFRDPRYRANPLDRCFYCKTSLYGAIAGAAEGVAIVSGTNLDDLGEYRPGLIAAREHGVRHPFVEAAMDKAAVRALARELDLGDVADLPAAPCLSSRVETGIAIEPGQLAMVHAVERFVAQQLRPRTVRCRVRRAGLVVELDEASLAGLGVEAQRDLRESIRSMTGAGREVTLAPYRNGSAFVPNLPS